jgi:hypothetical protein
MEISRGRKKKLPWLEKLYLPAAAAHSSYPQIPRPLLVFPLCHLGRGERPLVHQASRLVQLVPEPSNPLVPRCASLESTSASNLSPRRPLLPDALFSPSPLARIHLLSASLPDPISLDLQATSAGP